MKVMVLMGGPTAEHSVSVSSGRQVVLALDARGHQVLPIIIDKRNHWYLADVELLRQADTSLDPERESSAGIIEATNAITLEEARSLQPDVAFIAMHGPYGEDGKIQSLLEILSIPYTGSGVLASALSMNKLQFRRVMSALSLPIPSYRAFTNESEAMIMTTLQAAVMRPPLVVKPADQGSSIGVSIVHDWAELPAAIKYARSASSSVLVDEYIKGREFTVGVVALPKPTALPITEIITDREFFDYEAKYLSQTTREICPADLPATVAAEMQRTALAVFDGVGARHFSRVDFLLTKDNQPYILEINTIPGLTPASLLPKAAIAAQMTFEELIEKITDAAASSR